MNVRNCRGCGKIFNYVSGAALCQVCKEKMEQKFQEVKQYIREHPGVGIAEVSEACDVETAQIQTWLREERLEVTENSAIYLNCESCGTSIRSGKYCDRCKASMTNSFNSIIRESKPVRSEDKAPSKEGPKMRFL